MKAQHHVASIWIGVGKSEVVASGQRFSAHTLTLGGRAMEAAHRAVLRRERRQPSLPQHALCMPACFRRLPSAYHLDGIHLRIRRRSHFHWTSAYPLDARSQLHTMVCMRACVFVALCARFPRDCSCARRWLVPFMGSKRMCRAARTRVPCIKVSMQCLLYIT